MTEDRAFLPYGRQSVSDDDIAAVTKALRSAYLTTGPEVAAFEAALSDTLGGPEVVACANGTAALHLANLAAGIGAGDQVIVPAITFLATANAAVMAGAEVIFADCSPDTGLMTARTFADALDRAPRAKAVLPVHLNGHLVDADVVTAARGAGLTVIADSCHALGGGRINPDAKTPSVIMPGSGHEDDLATFSFHPVKPITMGEGGAIATRDSDMAAHMRRLRHHGMMRVDTLPGERGGPSSGETSGYSGVLAPTGSAPWYYEMAELGFNYRATDFQCALGRSQLSRLPDMQARRQQRARRYGAALDAALGAALDAEAAPIRLVQPAADCQSGWHLAAVQIDFSAIGIDRGTLMARLASDGIGSQVHYIPLPFQPYYQKALETADFAGARAYYAGALSLPLYPDMTDGDVDFVVSRLVHHCV